MRTGAGATDGEEIRTDVCIIGAGPAGLTVARELDAHGIGACLLESGGLEVEPDVQKQNRGESDGYPLELLQHCRVRAFGGTLRHPRIGTEAWAARPLDAVDFEAPSDGSGIGWPFDRAALEPYYARAISTSGIRSQDEATAWWSAHASPAAVELAREQLAPAVFQFATVSFRDAWSLLSTSTHVRVLLHSRVVDVRVDSDGRVERLTVARDDRSRLVVRPRLVVLAAGGIENPRMLLTANGGRGLGNEHDLVGRYFSERLSFHAGHVVLTGAVSTDDLVMLHRPPGLAIGGGLRVAEDVQRERGLRNCAFFLMPRPTAVTAEGVRSLSTLRKALDRRPMVDGVGAHLRHAVTAAPALTDIALGRFVPRPQSLMVRVQGEPTPNRESRVTLGTRRDDLGTPVARVTWRIAEGDHASLRASGEVIDGMLRAHGIGCLEWTAEPESTLIGGNHHHLGTTRMHPDPARGVVDADCRVHSVPNLYVAGCSVFPRYGAANPTLTIIALAHRLADHLRDVLPGR